MKQALLLEEIQKLKRRILRANAKAQNASSVISFFTHTHDSTLPYSCRFSASNTAQISISFEMSVTAETDATLYINLDNIALDATSFHFDAYSTRSYTLNKTVRGGGTLSIAVTSGVTLSDLSVIITGENVHKHFSFNSLEIISNGEDYLLNCVCDGYMKLYSLPLSKICTLTQNFISHIHYLSEDFPIIGRIHQDGSLLLRPLYLQDETLISPTVQAFTFSKIDNSNLLFYLSCGNLFYRIFTADDAISLSPAKQLMGLGLRSVKTIHSCTSNNTSYLVIESEGSSELFTIHLSAGTLSLTNRISLRAKNIQSLYYSDSLSTLFIYTKNDDGYICESTFSPSSLTISAPSPQRLCDAFARYKDNLAYTLDNGNLNHISLS